MQKYSAIYKQAMPLLKILHPLIPKIQNSPRKFLKSWMGKILLNAYRLVPHWFPKRLYELPRMNRPVKIVFSGMGDSVIANYTDPKFKDRYGDNLVYTFSWSQYPQAMKWCALNLRKDQPVQVFGYSWGGNAARKFINTYPGNVISGHFLDPMRPKANSDRTLLITRDVPITFTPAGDYVDSPFKTSLFDALRYKPMKGMKITAPVLNHGAVDQWLDVLDGAQPVYKQHNLTIDNAAYKAIGGAKALKAMLASKERAVLPQISTSTLEDGTPKLTLDYGDQFDSVIQNQIAGLSMEKAAAISVKDMKSVARPHYLPGKWQHVLQVMRDARKIKQKPLSDRLRAAILWHDSAKRDFGVLNHGLNGARIALQELPKWYTPLDIRIVAKAIRQHNLDLRMIPGTSTLSIKQFDSPEGLLLAIADDIRPLDLAKTWKKTLDYNFKHTPDKTPALLYKHMKTRLDPRNRMPLLKTYGKQFNEVNKDFISWLDRLTLQDVADKMKEHKNV